MTCLELFSLKFSLSGNKKTFNLRQNLDFTIPRVKSVNHGFESVTYLGPTIWESIPSKIREKNSLKKFNYEIKQWKPNSCSCRLCKRYIQHIGYIYSFYMFVIIYYLHHHVSPVFKIYCT